LAVVVNRIQRQETDDIEWTSGQNYQLFREQ
jgi:hypothetical protein